MQLFRPPDLVQMTGRAGGSASIQTSLADCVSNLKKTFLARTAWRIAINKLPLNRNERQNVPIDVEIPSTDTSPEQAAIVANLHSIVHRLVDALTEELRQPLALSTLEELNSREIARVMAVAEGTVRTRLMRARKMLKQKLTAMVEGRYEK
jgi:RNA polymerase sigma-70 factor, ECF subfamily